MENHAYIYSTLARKETHLPNPHKTYICTTHTHKSKTSTSGTIIQQLVLKENISMGKATQFTHDNFNVVNPKREPKATSTYVKLHSKSVTLAVICL